MKLKDIISCCGSVMEVGDYDGEETENYTFVCKHCGKSKTISGYVLDECEPEEDDTII